MSCNICQEDLPSDGDFITCGTCQNNLHFKCAGIKSTTWRAKSKKSKAEWQCNNCREGRPRLFSLDSNDDEEEPDDPTYRALKKLIIQMFKNQEKKFNAKIENVFEKITQLEIRNQNISEQLKENEKKILSLNQEMEELKVTMECEKQYGRSRNLLIMGLPSEKNEDILEVVTKTLSSMDLEIRKEDITSHRLPSKKEPSPIIVQFPSKGLRDKIMVQAKKIRPKLSLLDAKYPNTPIYFNDHLTPYFSKLMLKSRQIKVAMGYKYLWFKGNSIMMRKDDNSRAVKITKEKDLERLA